VSVRLYEPLQSSGAAHIKPYHIIAPAVWQVTQRQAATALAWVERFGMQARPSLGAIGPSHRQAVSASITCHRAIAPPSSPRRPAARTWWRRRRPGTATRRRATSCTSGGRSPPRGRTQLCCCCSSSSAASSFSCLCLHAPQVRIPQSGAGPNSAAAAPPPPPPPPPPAFVFMHLR
jgi:hypothetical protein